MTIKKLIPNKVSRRLSREFKLTGVQMDAMSIKEDSARYNSCLIYRISPEEMKKYERKINAQMKRDRDNMTLSFARVMS